MLCDVLLPPLTLPWPIGSPGLVGPKEAMPPTSSSRLSGLGPGLGVLLFRPLLVLRRYPAGHTVGFNLLLI